MNAPDGTESRTVYDGQGRVVWQTDRYYTGATSTSTPDNNTTANATQTLYDANGQTIGTRRYTDALITITADPSVGVAGIEQSSLASPGTQISANSTFYNGLGQVAESVDATGLRTGTIYSPTGQSLYSGILSDSVSDAPASAWWLTVPANPDSTYLTSLFASYTTSVRYSTMPIYISATSSWA